MSIISFYIVYLYFSAEIVMYPPPTETVVNWNSTAFLRCQVSFDYERYDLIYVWKFNGQIIDIEEDPYFILVSVDSFNTQLYVMKNNFRNNICSIWNNCCIISILMEINYTVKPVHVVTSIKQSPVFKGHLFLILSQKMSYTGKLNLF